jgi:hypothetical protein
MKKQFCFGALGALLVAGESRAAPSPTTGLLGSDTLNELITLIIAQCDSLTANPLVVDQAAVTSKPVNFPFTGGGSTGGETAMTGASASQSVAPMSRALAGARACTVNSGKDAQNAAIALDALSILTGNVTCPTGGAANAAVHTTGGMLVVTDRDTISGVQCPACGPGNNYTFNSFRDVLRILYAGVDHNSNPASCGGDLRRSLVTILGNVLTNCAGGSCPNGLQFALRRGDRSGTSDTLLSLLGLPAIAFTGARVTATPFCNGVDSEDLDPIRVAATSSDAVSGRVLCTVGGDPNDPSSICEGAGRTLGLVLPIVVPTNAAAAAVRYPNSDPNGQNMTCSRGVFGFTPIGRDAKRNATERFCPEGRAPLGTSCLAPKSNTASVGFNCVNLANNLSPTAAAFPAALRPDGRVYNRYLRNTNGTLIRDPFNNQIVGAYYRNFAGPPIDVNTKAAPPVCVEADSTTQIGCIVAKRSCTVGFAGFGADNNYPSRTVTGAVPSNPAGVAAAVAVGGVRPLLGTDTPPDVAVNIQGGTYPLTRRLYFNSLFGGLSTGATTGARATSGTPATAFSAGQKALTECTLDSKPAFPLNGQVFGPDARVLPAPLPTSVTMLDYAVQLAGYFRLPGGPQVTEFVTDGAGVAGSPCCVNTDCTSGRVCTASTCQ